MNGIGHVDGYTDRFDEYLAAQARRGQPNGNTHGTPPVPGKE